MVSEQLRQNDAAAAAAASPSVIILLACMRIYTYTVFSSNTAATHPSHR